MHKTVMDVINWVFVVKHAPAITGGTSLERHESRCVVGEPSSTHEVVIFGRKCTSQLYYCPVAH